MKNVQEIRELLMELDSDISIETHCFGEGICASGENGITAVVYGALGGVISLSSYRSNEAFVNDVMSAVKNARERPPIVPVYASGGQLVMAPA